LNNFPYLITKEKGFRKTTPENAQFGPRCPNGPILMNAKVEKIIDN